MKGNAHARCHLCSHRYVFIRASTPGPIGRRHPRGLSYAGDCRRARRVRPGIGRSSGRHGPASTQRLGSPRQRAWCRRPARPATDWPQATARRRATRPLQGDGGAGAGYREGRDQPLDCRGSLPTGQARVRGELQRERHAGHPQEARPVLAKDPTESSQGRFAGSRRLQDKISQPDQQASSRARASQADRGLVLGRATNRSDRPQYPRVAPQGSPPHGHQGHAPRGRLSVRCCLSRARHRIRPGSAARLDRRHERLSQPTEPATPRRSPRHRHHRPGRPPWPSGHGTCRDGSAACWRRWHCSKDPAIPDNPTPIFLPPYSPELNAIERLWLDLKERFLSHRPWPAYDDIVDAVRRAWNQVLDDTGRIKSLCSLDWAVSVKN